MLAGDSRGAWDAHVLDDPRVVSLWDGSRLAGRWFADHSIGGLGAPGDIVWDAYLAFGKSARWRREPERHHRQHERTRAGLHPAPCARLNSGAQAMVDGYDRSDGQATLPAAKP